MVSTRGARGGAEAVGLLANAKDSVWKNADELQEVDAEDLFATASRR